MNVTLKSIVEDATSPAGRAFVLLIQSLIFLSLLTYAIATIPDLDQSTRDWLRIIEIVTVAIFTLEYFIRILVADNRLRFVFSFYGVIDLIAILPFYIAFGVPYVASSGLDLRFLRAVRMLRLFRAFKIVRYSKAARLFGTAFKLAKEELVLFFIAAGMLLYLAAAGIHFFEYESQPEEFSSLFTSLWWAVVTLTTVGYGDVYPVTLGGRIFTFFLLMIGLGTIAVPSGIMAAALGKARQMETDDIQDAQEADK